MDYLRPTCDGCHGSQILRGDFQFESSWPLGLEVSVFAASRIGKIPDLLRVGAELIHKRNVIFS